MCIQFRPGRLVYLVWPLIYLLAFTVAALAGEVTDTIERNFTVSGKPTIIVRNGDGRTRITSDSQSRVYVKAIREVRNVSSHTEAVGVAERVQIRIEQSGDRIEVEAKYPSHMAGFFGSKPEVLVHFEINAPKTSNIDARSGDGSLAVNGFDGRIELTTGDGELTADNCSGSLTAGTGDGSLQIENLQGDVTAHSGDGRISLNGIFRGLEVRSGDGDIDIHVGAGSRMEKDWSIRSEDGDVRLRLPGDFNATCDITTGDGRIDSELPITPEGFSSQNRLIGKLNNGGYRLRIQTSDGSVNIRKS